MAVVFVTSGFAALSFIPGIWIFDQLSQFRLIYPLILAICLPILCALRAFRALVLSLILLIVTTIPVATMFFPTRGAVADGSARPQEIPLSVLNFNSEFQHNDNYKSFDELVKTREPDVVAIVEINQKWMDALSETMKSYPFRKFVNEGAGLALFSKYPIVKNRIEHFGKSRHPRMFAELKVKDRIINVIVAHPATPKTLWGFEERNSEIRLLADEIKAISGPKIFIGDYL